MLLTTTSRDLQEDKHQLSEERSRLERALAETRGGTETQEARVLTLERQQRDMRVELEQKMEIGQFLIFSHFD